MKLDVPVRCDSCNSENIVFKDSGKLTLWPFIWYCNDCYASVTCHVGSNKPLGYMAPAYIRRMRADLHELIDPLWQSGFAKRTEIYGWLAKHLDIEKDQFHISHLSVGQLKLAIKLAKDYLVEHSDLIEQARRTNDRFNEGKRNTSNRDRFVRSKPVRHSNRSRSGRYSRTDRDRYK